MQPQDLRLQGILYDPGDLQKLGLLNLNEKDKLRLAQKIIDDEKMDVNCAEGLELYHQSLIRKNSLVNTFR